MRDEDSKLAVDDHDTSDVVVDGWLGDAAGVRFEVRRVGRRHMRCIAMGLAFVLSSIALGILAIAFYLVMLGWERLDL